MGERRTREWCPTDTEVQSGKVKNAWRWLGVVVAQLRECASRHVTVHLEMVRMVHFMLFILHCREKKNSIEVKGQSRIKNVRTR